MESKRKEGGEASREGRKRRWDKGKREGKEY